MSQMQTVRCTLATLVLAAAAEVLAAAADGVAQDRASSCCNVIRSITDLITAPGAEQSEAIVEVRWPGDPGDPPQVALVDPDPGTTSVPNDYDWRADIVNPDDPLAQAARECERHEYRSKLRSTFSDIDKLHSAFRLGRFEEALTEYVYNKAVSLQLNAVQRSIPFKVSVATSDNALIFKLHSPCGFNAPLARVETSASEDAAEPKDVSAPDSVLSR